MTSITAAEADVAASGKVSSVAEGEATITVFTVDGSKTATSKTATCKVTVKPSQIEGALNGTFSVSADKKVYFSKGNLVATVNQSGTPTAWKFAEKQYNFLADKGANKNIGKQAGDVDLFGWSISTTGTATTNNYGIKTSENKDDYSGSFYDWGKAIGDGNTFAHLHTPRLTRGRGKCATFYSPIKFLNSSSVAKDTFVTENSDPFG